VLPIFYECVEDAVCGFGLEAVVNVWSAAWMQAKNEDDDVGLRKCSGLASKKLRASIEWAALPSYLL
jgi:hypothetical protein